jgi:hypothetical protein
MGAGEVQPSLHHPLGGLQRGVGPAPHTGPGPAHQAPRPNQNNHRYNSLPFWIVFLLDPLSVLSFSTDAEFSDEMKTKSIHAMFRDSIERTSLFRGRILGRKPDKNLKSFPPCYSQSPLRL